MFRAPAIAKFVLGVFVLSGPLCACPAFAIGEADQHDSHASGHPVPEATVADCHGGDSRSDCGMAAESDAWVAKHERTSDLSTAAVDDRGRSLVVDRTARSSPLPPSRSRPPGDDDPVTNYDRMLD